MHTECALAYLNSAFAVHSDIFHRCPQDRNLPILVTYFQRTIAYVYVLVVAKYVTSLNVTDLDAGHNLNPIT